MNRLAPLVPDSLPYWEGLQQERLTLPRCVQCHRLIAYPRSFCPHCGNDQVAWEVVAGRGRVYSFTIIHHSRSSEWMQRVPYVAAIVELEPGARMTTRLVDCDSDDVRVGMDVEIMFDTQEDGLKVPLFRPIRV